MVKDKAKWAYWTKQIKEWQASGLSHNAYCQREGLKPITFDYWRPLIVSSHAEVKTVKQAVSSNDTLTCSMKLNGRPILRSCSNPSNQAAMQQLQ